MGPLAGWHRLRLLRQIGDELVPGVEQFLLIKALFMTVWCPGSRSVESNYDIRRG